MSTAELPSDVLPELAAHLDEVCDAAERRGFDAMARELRKVVGYQDVTCTVAVVGERSRGKSTLINGLLGRSLLPTDVDVTTNSHIVVRAAHPSVGPAETARIMYDSGRSQTVDAAALASYVSEAQNPANVLGVQRAEVFVDSPLLEEGFVVVDTPGVGGLMSVHGKRTKQAVDAADGFIMVLDAEKPIGTSELDFVASLSASAGRLILTLNRRQVAGDPHEIVEFDRRALREHTSLEPDAPVVVVNARAAERAGRERIDDPEYAEELLQTSNLAELIALMRSVLLQSVIRMRAEFMLARSSAALDDLERPLRESEAAATGAGVEWRAEAIEQALASLEDRKPLDRLDRRLVAIEAQIAQRFTDGLAELADRVSAMIDTSTAADTAALTLTELQTGVDALWGEAVNQLRASVADALADAMRDLGFAPAQLEVGDVSGRGLGAALQPGEQAAQREGQGAAAFIPTAVRLAFSGLVMLILGYPVDPTILSVLGLAFQDRESQQTAKRDELKRSIERRVGSAQRAFTAAFTEMSTELRDRAHDALFERFQSRVSSLKQSLETLSDLESPNLAGNSASDQRSELRALLDAHSALATRMRSPAA